MQNEVVAIIPAKNEAEYIGSVLQIVIDSHLFCDILVVDDGSTDHTSEVAEAMG